MKRESLNKCALEKNRKISLEKKPQNKPRDRMLIVKQIREDKYLNIHEPLIRSFG